AVANAKLVPARNGEYDLDLLLMMDIKFRGGDPSLAKPRFAWFEVHTQNADEKTPVWRRLEVKNVFGYPSPAWSVTVPAWPHAPGSSNVLKDPALPSISAWWLEAWPANSQRLARKSGLSPEKSFNGARIQVGDVEATIDSVSFVDGNLLVRMSG